jgi:hypothetical protein
MPDPVDAPQIDTQSAPITGQLQPPAPAPQPQPQQPQTLQGPAAQPAPGSGFHSLSHAFMGAVLGAVAGSQKEVAPPKVDENGVMQPAQMGRATTGDQLRKIARSALLGLAAGSRIGPQKSGLAAAASGLGAGAEDAITRQKEQGLLERKQAGEDFERQQQMMLNKATNAHTIIETARAAQELRNATMESQSKYAALGQDRLGAVAAGGNKIIAQDMTWDEALKFRQDNPDYLKYKPFLTRVVPVEGAVPDPKTGEMPVEKRYSLAEIDKPVKLTPVQVEHLKAVGIPGAESLETGQTIPFEQWNALDYQGLKKYNEALTDTKNWHDDTISDKNGNPIKVSINSVLGIAKIMKDPDTGEPLSGERKTTFKDIWNPGTQQLSTWVVDDRTGQKLHYVGPSKGDMNTPVGDYSLTGEPFIQSLPPQMWDTVQAIHDRRQSVTSLPRGQEKQKYIDAVNHAYPNDPYDEKKYPLEVQYLKEYQSGTHGEGAARDRINTAIGHLDLLGQVATGLPQEHLRALNQLANEYGIQTDQPEPVLYDMVANKAAAEAANAVKIGGSASDQEIEAQRKNLNRNAGPNTQKAQIVGNLDLLKTQIETIRDKFKSNMSGRTPESVKQPVVSEKNQAIMDKWTAVPGQGGPPAGTVHVQIPGQPAGYVSQDKLADFQKKYPNAQVIK